jgi:predicted nuclease of restriction endonuclease-like RecB superfamily
VNVVNPSEKIYVEILEFWSRILAKKTGRKWAETHTEKLLILK